MKKLSITLLLLLGLAGCSTTGLTVHKNDVHALIEKNGNKTCVVQFEDKLKDIKTDFGCDQVKYFDNNK